MSEIEMIQVVIHPALRPHLERWLTARNLVLFRMPDFPDDLPTYGVGPNDDDPGAHRG